MDIVVGKRRTKACLRVLTERKSRKEINVFFYTHSFSLWERGSNENNNKLIRRHIPKGEDIEEYSKEEIKKIEKWMNEYPRELFQRKTSNEMYETVYNITKKGDTYYCNLHLSLEIN